MATDADGDCGVAWESGRDQDGEGYGVYAQRVGTVLPADANGATPGAEARSTLLVCYQVKLPKGSKFRREIVGTRSRTAGVRTVGRRKPTELCVVARAFPGN